MHGRHWTFAPLIAAVTLVALSACGSSNSASSSAASTPTATTAPTSAAANSSSSFCQQASATIAQLSQVGASFRSTSPGATPSVASFQQLFASAATAIDSLDGSAPSEIAPAFHALRAAYDQAETQVRAATTFQQMSSALTALGSSTVATAGSQASAYLHTSCGINTSPSP